MLTSEAESMAAMLMAAEHEAAVADGDTSALMVTMLTVAKQNARKSRCCGNHGGQDHGCQERGPVSENRTDAHEA